MERVDRRVPIKVIALELGVSETRINQHIRALKDVFDAGHLGELVEKYRSYAGLTNDDDAPQAAPRSGDDDAEERAPIARTDGEAEPIEPLSEAAYSNSQVPGAVFGFDISGRDNAGTVEVNDILPLLERTPWLKPGEPKVVPGLLDGEHAVLFRLAAIMGIAFGFMAVIVLTLTAAVTISEALDGRAAVPVDEKGFS
jgi:hypothetical protein